MPPHNQGIDGVNRHTQFRTVGQPMRARYPQFPLATNPDPNHRLIPAEIQHEQSRQQIPEDLQRPHVQRQAENLPARTQQLGPATNQPTAPIHGGTITQLAWDSMMFQPTFESGFGNAEGRNLQWGFRRGSVQAAALSSTSTMDRGNASEM
jgi:hypothetical protein